MGASAGDRVVDPPPGHAGDGAVGDAEERRGEHDRDRDAERVAGAVNHPREDVAAALVGAEQVRHAGRLQPVADIEEHRVGGRDQPGRRGKGDEHGHHEQGAAEQNLA